MRNPARTVAREIADRLTPGAAAYERLVTRDDLNRWLLLLAPPRKSPRVRSKGVRTRRANARELNGLLREILLIRDKASCRKCGRSSGKLDVSHVFAKGSHRWLRWDLDNVKLLCAAPCHLTWWHGHPEEGMKWWETQIGPTRMQNLRLKAGHPQKKDFESWKLYLEAEKKKLEGQ